MTESAFDSLTRATIATGAAERQARRAEAGDYEHEHRFAEHEHEDEDEEGPECIAASGRNRRANLRRENHPAGGPGG